MGTLQSTSKCSSTGYSLQVTYDQAIQGSGPPSLPGAAFGQHLRVGAVCRQLNQAAGVSKASRSFSRRIRQDARGLVELAETNSNLVRHHEKQTTGSFLLSLLGPRCQAITAASQAKRQGHYRFVFERYRAGWSKNCMSNLSTL